MSEREAIVVLTDDEFDRLSPGHPGRDERWAALYRRCRLDRVRPAGYHVVQEGQAVVDGQVWVLWHDPAMPNGPYWLRPLTDAIGDDE